MLMRFHFQVHNPGHRRQGLTHTEEEKAGLTHSREQKSGSHTLQRIEIRVLLSLKNRRQDLTHPKNRGRVSHTPENRKQGLTHPKDRQQHLTHPQDRRQGLQEMHIFMGTAAQPHLSNAD